jgi:hypothetical protein
MNKLADRSFGAKPAEIIGTEYSSRVTMATVGSMPAESSVIPRAVSNLGLRINVKEWTLLIRAGMKARVEITFGHLAHVVLVEKLTHVSLLTETPKPVFAHDCPVSLDVSVRTRGSSSTGSFQVEDTHSGS